MNLEVELAAAIASVPGILRCVLVLLPDRVILAQAGSSALDLEPLVRAAALCLAGPTAPSGVACLPATYVEFSFLTEHEVVVIQGGRTERRLGLAVECTREANLALVLASTRRAIGTLEASIPIDTWVG